MTDPGEQANEHTVDAPYVLWLVTATCVAIATLLLTAQAAAYLIDVTLTLKGKAAFFRPGTYVRLLELAALFAAVAVVVHLYRLRLEAIRHAPILVPWPRPVVINPPGQTTYSRYECSCKVTLAFDEEPSPSVLLDNARLLHRCLENAFALAVTDPVIRFSKAKMEQTMRVAARHVLGNGVSHVIMSEIRQRRVPLEPAPGAANGNACDRNAAAG